METLAIKCSCLILNLFYFVFLGRIGGRVHGNLFGGDGHQDPGRRVHPAQGQLPQKPLEHHGLHRRRFRVK